MGEIVPFWFAHPSYFVYCCGSALERLNPSKGRGSEPGDACRRTKAAENIS